MKNLLSIVLFSLLAICAACGSKGDGNRNSNSNRDASNQPPMNVNMMNQNSSNQNSADMNVNIANTNAMPINPDATLHTDMQTAPNASSAPYDLQFIDTMIAHHQAAVVMAKAAMEKAQHPELRSMAQNIVTGQEKEISQMRQWRDQWFKDQPLAVNMEAAGMVDSMKTMDMSKLGTLTGNSFDLAFIEMMIPHHQGALAMAKEALEKAQHPEIKTLAQGITMTQETEIESMQNWKNAWSKQ